MCSPNKVPTTTQSYILAKPSSYKNLVLRETPIPAIGSHNVLVKIHAVSLQYRDLVVTNGQYPDAILPDLIPCSDMAGEIIRIGASIAESNQWKVGDRVYANFSPNHVYGPVTPEAGNIAFGGSAQGMLTQYKVVPAHNSNHVPIVPSYNALHGPVPIKAGDTVLVLGTGGVFALQIAVASGATVIATSSSKEKLEIATKSGAKHVIHYKVTPEWHEEVLKITNGRGADHIIEVVGQLDKSVLAAKMGTGQIYIIGFVSGGNSFPIVLPVLFQAATIRGIRVGSVSQFEDMVRLIEANQKTTRPVIDRVFDFDKTIEAFERLESQKHVGKVVIRIKQAFGNEVNTIL